jgi:hypothetical protein
VISQDNANLFWDNTNKRLGIGTNSPAEKLHVVGNLRVTGYENPNHIYLESLTSDPPLAAGKMWFRSDLQRVRYSPDGVNVISIDPSWTPTFERYADISLAAGASYTPSVKGLFSATSSYTSYESVAANYEYYSSSLSSWYKLSQSAAGVIPPALGDGVNFRIKNWASATYQVIIMRMS